MTLERVRISMPDPEVSRRRFLAGLGLAGATIAANPRVGWGAEKELFVHPASVDHHVVPALIALREGYWEAEGLDVSTMFFRGGGPLTQAIVAGQVKIGTGGFPTVVSAWAKNIPLKWVSAAEKGGPGWGIVALDPSIKSVADLKGKKVGTGRAGATSHWWALQVANWQKWKVGTDIQLVAVGGSSDLEGALVAKHVDAVVLWPPNIPLLASKHKEAHLVLSMFDVVKEFLGEYEGEGWFATEDYIENKPHVVKGMLKGYYRGVKFLQDNLAEAAAIAAKEWKLDNAVALAALEETAPYFKLDGAIDKKGCEVVIKSLAEMGTIKDKVPSVTELIDERFLPVKI